MIKKNITINFSGRLYAIDEDACELLSHYTDTLRRYFKNEGTEEVADDIESRIAELFDEQIAQGANAINLQMVQAVIRQVGELSELAPGAEKSESQSGEEATKSVATTTRKTGRKLYRDLEHKMICGVCSGFERYLGIGAIWFRIGFVVITLAPLLLTMLPFGVGMSGFGIIGFVMMLFRFSINFMPVIIYLVCAFVIPAALEPEDRLRMMGKEVNPQNLSEEISRKPDLGRSSVMAGCFSILYRTVAFLVGIGSFVMASIFAIALFVSRKTMSLGGGSFFSIDNFDDPLLQQINEATHDHQIVFITCFFLAFAVLIYCCFHAVTRGYGSGKSMSGAQRLSWIGGILILVATCIYCSIHCSNVSNKIRSEHYVQEQESHTHYGYYFSDTDWEFFQKGNWQLIKAENLTDYRFTYAGEYPDGDSNERYLDAYSYDRNLLYRVERTDSVEAGTYELYSLARCSEGDAGAFIYAIVVDKEGQETQYLQEIPGYGHLSVGNLPNGWCHITLSNITVPEGAKVRYGVTTDKAQTGKYCNVQYVSATDFKLTKK